jgi:hypothetical protein
MKKIGLSVFIFLASMLSLSSSVFICVATHATETFGLAQNFQIIS